MFVFIIFTVFSVIAASSRFGEPEIGTVEKLDPREYEVTKLYSMEALLMNKTMQPSFDWGLSHCEVCNTVYIFDITMTISIMMSNWFRK